MTDICRVPLLESAPIGRRGLEIPTANVPTSSLIRLWIPALSRKLKWLPIPRKIASTTPLLTDRVTIKLCDTWLLEIQLTLRWTVLRPSRSAIGRLPTRTLLVLGWATLNRSRYNLACFVLSRLITDIILFVLICKPTPRHLLRWSKPCILSIGASDPFRYNLCIRHLNLRLATRKLSRPAATLVVGKALISLLLPSIETWLEILTILLRWRSMKIM